jgi:hypothetical protein
MAGIDWAGLPYVVELLGIHDIELLVCQLNQIRDSQHPPERQP